MPRGAHRLASARDGRPDLPPHAATERYCRRLLGLLVQQESQQSLTHLLWLDGYDETTAASQRDLCEAQGREVLLSPKFVEAVQWVIKVRLLSSIRKATKAMQAAGRTTLFPVDFDVVACSEAGP